MEVEVEEGEEGGDRGVWADDDAGRSRPRRGNEAADVSGRAEGEAAMECSGTLVAAMVDDGEDDEEDEDVDDVAGLPNRLRR